MTKLIVVYRNFATASKNVLNIQHKCIFLLCEDKRLEHDEDRSKHIAGIIYVVRNTQYKGFVDGINL
jgi:hypothetical protein